jgi:superfamily I DNA and/or RNA helicase
MAAGHLAHQLVSQYRMHPDVCRVVSDLFYG